MKDRQMQEAIKKAPSVRETAKQGAEACDPRSWGWVEAEVWTECMLAAKANGGKGGKWFSLMDKVYALRTLASAWMQVAKNGGAEGGHWPFSTPIKIGPKPDNPKSVGYAKLSFVKGETHICACFKACAQ